MHNKDIGKHMKSFRQFREDAGGIAAPGPVNAVSTGAIAGTGEKGGEPGVNMKKKNRVIVQPMTRRNPPKS
jgi:hypothetical protein